MVAVKRPILGVDFLRHYELLVDVTHQRLLHTPSQSLVQGVTCSDQSMQLTLLSSEPTNRYEAVLKILPSVVGTLTGQVPVKHNVTHHITTKGPPVHARARHLPPEWLSIAHREFDHMLKLAWYYTTLLKCLVISSEYGSQEVSGRLASLW